MRFPSVTVHVTVKNSESTIKSCIDSLLRLNYPNKKIVVTDAFSTDSTYDILKTYGHKISLEQVKGFAPHAHNHILQKVNTEFYAVTDADCTVDRNWLRNLISAFKSKDVIAAGGIVKTPKNVNKLQDLIGRELENRYHHFPKIVSRFPTMSMIVRTSVAKKVKMNENLQVAFETDWGFKLEKFGKLVYVPSAVVWHYHRGSLTSFFKQQMNYAKFTPQVYTRHIEKTKGDYISTPLMFAQEFLFLTFSILFFLTLFTSVFSNNQPPSFLSRITFFSFVLLLLPSYLIDAIPLSRNAIDVILYQCLFFIRNIAWTVGLIRSVFGK